MGGGVGGAWSTTTSVLGVKKQHYGILVIIWLESVLPTRTFDFVTSTKFVNAYCNRSRSLVNLTSTSNAGVVKIDDVTNNSNNQISIAPYASYYIYAVTSAGNSLYTVHGRWPDVWTTAATAACCTQCRRPRPAGSQTDLRPAFQRASCRSPSTVNRRQYAVPLLSASLAYQS